MRKGIYICAAILTSLTFNSCKDVETEYVDKIIEIEKKDTTPTAAIYTSRISVTAGDSQVLLSWKNPTAEDFYGTRITFTPTASNVTQPIVIEGNSGATSSAWFNGLSNDVSYTFSFVALDKSQNESKKVSKTATPKSSADKTPPSAVTNSEAVAGNQKIILSWTNPTDEDFYGVWISEKNSSGTLLNPVFLKSPANSFIVSELENAVEYKFSIIAIDDSLNQSQPELISESPVDTADRTPPDEVGNIYIMASDENAVITWASPSDDDFEGVEISVNPAAGTLAYPILVRKVTNNIFVSGLETGEAYTFKIRTYDSSYNFSEGKQKTATVGDSSDRTPPSKVTETHATGSEKKVILSWRNPDDEDFFGVQISEKNNSGTLSAPVFIAKPATSFTVSELTNSTEYDFSIVAMDNSFNKSDAVTVTGTPVSSADVTAPNNVTGVAVSASDGDAVISWNNPSNSDFAGVKISMNPTAGTLSNPVEVSETVTSISVGGLTVGETYTFTLQSFDTSKNYSSGASKTATVADTTDYTPPASVTNLSAAAVDGTAIISWTPPTDSDFAGLKISMTPAEGTLANPIEVNKSVTSISAGGLTVGETYTFTIKSFDTNRNYSDGVSKSVTVSDTSDYTPPAKITNGSAACSDGKIILSWRNPDDEDFYGVQISEKNSSGTLSSPVFIAKPATSFTVSELDNDTEYVFSIVALDNSFNKSDAVTVTGTPVSSADVTSPNNVTGVTVSASDGDAVISWNNPSNSDFAGVKISMNPATGTLSNPVELSETVTSISVGGLTVGETYTFTLQSFDTSKNYSSGASKTAIVADTSDHTPPAEVVSLSVTASDGIATILWTSPSDSDFAGVEVSMNPAEGTLSNPVLVLNGTNSLFVSGLETGRTYNFKVRTYDTSNNFSTGKQKTTTVADTSDHTPPAEITNVTTSAVDGTAIISWMPPTNSDFAGVQISMSPAAGTLSNPVEVSKTVTSISVGGLTVGKTYTFTLKSFDTSKNYSRGVSKSAIVADTTDYTPPASVRNVNATCSDSKIILSWQIPTEEDFYGVQISEKNNSGTLSSPVFIACPATSFTVSELTNSKEYEFSIVAMDKSFNKSDIVTVFGTPVSSADVTAPNDVTRLTVSASDGNAEISWNNPSNSDFAGVKISMTPSAGTLSNPIEVEESVTSISISGLTIGETYTFTVQSFDTSKNYSSGVSRTATVADTSDHTPPAEVSEAHAAGSENKVILSWQNPSDEDFYGVQISEKNNSGTLSSPVFIAGPATSFTVSELENGSEYEFLIVALDKSFNKSDTVTVRGTPVSLADKTAPNDVTGLTVSASDGNAEISWNNPSDSDFAGVKISMTPAEGTLANPIEVSKNATSIFVSGLSIGENYTFTIQSFDTSKNYSRGVSKTLSVADTADHTAPANVTNLTAINKGGAILLSWSDAIDSDCYSYEVSVDGKVHSIILQGKEQCRINGLTNGIVYTFTVKSLDVSGNKSEGKTVTLAPENVSLTINLTVPSDPDYPSVSINPTLSNTSADVNVTINAPAQIEKAVWKAGVKNVVIKDKELLADNTANTLSLDSNGKASFTVTKNGWYDVVAIDSEGHSDWEQIEVRTIDKVASEGVNGLISSFDSEANNAKPIKLSWTEPAPTSAYDSPIDHIEVTYVVNDETEVINVGSIPAGLQELRLSIPEGREADDILRVTVTAVDGVGNVSLGKSVQFLCSDDVLITKEDYVEKIAGITANKRLVFVGDIDYYPSVIGEELNKLYKKNSEIKITLDLANATGLKIGYHWTGDHYVYHGSFKGIQNLVAVALPKTLESMTTEKTYGQGEYGAFQDCENLESVTIYDSCKEIGKHAFKGCTKLKTINIPNSVTKIWDSSFADCISLESIEIPSSVKTINRCAFSGCTSLTSVNLPSVTSIDEYAFSSCTSLTSINLPSVTSIGKYVFSSCTSLTSINLPDSVTYINESAFKGCTSLTSINLPSVTSIGKYTFYECTGLRNIELPTSMRLIEPKAFANCTKLMNVIFDDCNSIWYYTETYPSSSGATGTEIGKMSVTDTAENANKLTTTYKNYYLFNEKYGTE